MLAILRCGFDYSAMLVLYWRHVLGAGSFAFGGGYRWYLDGVGLSSALPLVLAPVRNLNAGNSRVAVKP